MTTEQNGYGEQYSKMSPAEQFTELRGIFSLIPKVPEGAPMLDESYLPEYNTELQRRVIRADSSLKDVAADRLRALLKHSFFTPSGQDCLVTEFSMFFDHGMPEHALSSVAEGEDVFSAIYNWGETSAGALFDRNEFPALEHRAYRQKVKKQMAKKQFIDQVPDISKSLGNVIRGLEDLIYEYREEGLIDDEDMRRMKENEALFEEARENQHAYMDRYVHDELMYAEQIKLWRQEIVNRDGIEP